MNIGTHNSFTYLPVRQWWLKPFAFVARCQRVDFLKQIELGAAFLDMRIRFNKDGMPVICHGLTEFKHDNTFIQDVFKECQKIGGITIRIVLEINKRDSYQEYLFKDFCENAENKYTNINFVGGNNRNDWLVENPIYKFKKQLPELVHRYSSSTSLFTSANYILKKIDDWIPFYYAKRFNRFNLHREMLNKEAYMFIDFIDVR